MNSVDLIDKKIDEIVSAGFDPKTSRFEDKVPVMLVTAQGIIDNGGFEYFFEQPFDGDPDLSDFPAVYRAIGADACAAAFEAAIKASAGSNPDFDEPNEMMWQNSQSNFTLLREYLAKL